MSKSMSATVLQALDASEGQAIAWFGSLLTVKATKESTGGAYGLIEVVEPSGAASPLHVHHGEDEALWILDGEYTAVCGDQEIVASAGAFVLLPRGVAHSVRVSGPGLARALMLFTPGGFEGFFAELGEVTDSRELPPPSAPDPARTMAVAPAYRVEIVAPPPGH
jgi:mannose-6-phosphate isomerase-like protein (cupin superfamily)